MIFVIHICISVLIHQRNIVHRCASKWATCLLYDECYWDSLDLSLFDHIVCIGVPRWPQNDHNFGVLMCKKQEPGTEDTGYTKRAKFIYLHSLTGQGIKDAKHGEILGP